MQAGGDRSWLRPVQTSEKGLMPKMIGTYRGINEALNVYNPQPGFKYVWADTRPDRESDVIRKSLIGFQFVKTTDPEGRGREAILGELSHLKGTSQDTLIRYGKLALMKCPIDRYRRYRAERSALKASKLHAETSQFLDKDYEHKQALANAGSKRVPAQETYYQRPDHRPMDVEDVPLER